MPSHATAVDTLPAVAARALQKLGADLGIARKRRKQSLRSWALRLDVSVPTLMKMEKGDPSVSVGVYATALWVVQRHEALGALADPATDLAALKAKSRRQRVAESEAMAERGTAYQPRDQLGLWMLEDPAQPVLVGQLSLVLGGQGVALKYDPAWLQQGFPLSEDLPLIDELFLPREKQSAAGAVDDARPDRWGERVIRKFEHAPRMSLLEYLLFAGGDRYGALGVSARPDVYVPWASSPVPEMGELPAMQEVVRRVLANEPVREIEKRLLRPGVSLGGARPKSVIQIDGHPWLVKFGEGEDEDTPLIEHATMTLAARCGIEVAATRALVLGDHRHAVAVRRFDRTGNRRLHAVSAHVALRAVGEAYGYPQLAAQLRRWCRADAIKAQQAQLFRRMVFNILMDNTDDHEKNHALLRQPDGSWLLSPAFDVVSGLSGLGYQAMVVGADGMTSTLDNALSQASAFGLKPAPARSIVRELATVIAGWREHFQACGVGASDLRTLAQYLDGDRLGAQRRSVLGPP